MTDVNGSMVVSDGQEIWTVVPDLSYQILGVNPPATEPNVSGGAGGSVPQGFYQGRFYVTFFGEAAFSYGTADFGETWARHPHSDTSGKHTANAVQLSPSGKAFPHRLDR